jgi:hypothetical protein
MTKNSLALALALSVAAPLHAACTFGFLSPSSFGANANPGDVTTGDFNNDGYVDLAIVNRNTSTISLLLGNNNGGFNAATTITTESSQGDLLSGYFNADQNLDLVLAVPNGNNFHPHLKVLLGNGNGTFTAVAYTDQQAVYQNPERIVLGDFNKDGLMDAAVTKSSGMFSAMQNIGGKFAQKAEYTAYAVGLSTGIATGDFDGDGNLDLAVSEAISKKVYLFFGVGDGTFTAGATPIDLAHATWQPQDVEAADFNGDGKADLAIVIFDPYGGETRPPLEIALSNGVARTFGTPVPYGTLHGASEEEIKDIDGDGKLDVLVGNIDGLGVFRGNGDGTFAAPQTFGSHYALGLAIDDFDRDGGPDVVTTAFTTSEVDVFLNTCGRVSLNLMSSANPAAQGTAITITGTVVPPPPVAPTGTLTLKRGTTILNSANLNAGYALAATMNDLSPGTYAMSAEYSGDSRFIAATATLSQVVTVPPFGPPPGFNAISTGGPVQMSWYATANTDHYEVWRNNGAGWAYIGNTAIAAYTDNTAPATSAFLYRVRAVSAGATTSDYSAADLALTYTFTDGTLQPGVTPVKLAHLTELRNAANAVRGLGGLGAITWADASPQLIRSSHVDELRTAINQARTALVLTTATFTDPTLTVGTTLIRAAHFEELRTAMR